MTPRAVIDAAHLAHQREWSEATFGPGRRTLGVLDHIRKELAEIEDAPDDVEEWVDVIILAFDGALRAGWNPQEIIDAIKAKQDKNERRSWPDWRSAPPDTAIEHVRSLRRWDEVRPGDVVHGCGTVVDVQTRSNGRAYVRFDRTGHPGSIPADARGWYPGCNEWTRGVGAAERVTVEGVER